MGATITREQAEAVLQAQRAVQQAFQGPQGATIRAVLAGTHPACRAFERLAAAAEQLQRRSAFASAERALAAIQANPALWDFGKQWPLPDWLPDADTLRQAGEYLERQALQATVEPADYYLPPPRPAPSALTITVNFVPEEEADRTIYEAGVAEGRRQALAADPGGEGAGE